MGDVLQRTLHHPDDGAFLDLHRADLQRLLLQVSQHVRLWLERQSHVRQPAVDVSCDQNQPQPLDFRARGSFIPLVFFYHSGTKPSEQTLCSPWTPTSAAFSAVPTRLASIP